MLRCNGLCFVVFGVTDQGKTMLGKPHSAVALCLSFVVLLVPAIPYDRNDYDPQEVISSLNRVLDFYRREFKSINLDGIFGLRVAQGNVIRGLRFSKLLMSLFVSQSFTVSSVRSQ